MAVIEKQLNGTVKEKQLNGTLIEELPRNSWRKAIFKTPLYLWRLGLRYLLPPSFACITTRGRKTGLPRHTMVEHAEIDGKYYIVSGWQDRPHWLRNLLADPQITIQPVRGQPIAGTAQRVQDDLTLSQVFENMQRSPMWKPWLASLDIQPEISDFLAHKDRVYIFQITPTGEMVLPPLVQNLRWVTGLALGVSALLIVIGVRFANPKSAEQSK